ncbi:MAG: alpha/beta hydrolase [Alphaproteobacteria bacterium]|nr:alpha/beta hydrolase [Alphaproteobacteria bacterium]
MSETIDIHASQDRILKAIHRVPAESSLSSADDTLFLMSHSFPGNKDGSNDIFYDLEHLLVEKGYHTLRFDYYGCGGSDGQEQDFSLGGACEDFKHVIYWAEGKGYKNFAFIGEGLGATLSIMNVDLNVKMMILLWPVLDTNDYSENRFDLHQSLTGEAVQKGYFECDGHKVGMTLLKELRKNTLHYALKEVFMPVLIIQGVRDEIVPLEHLQIAKENMRSKRIEIFSFHDGGHAMDQLNHRSMIFHQISEFAAQNI